METELMYRVALTRIKGIGPVHAKSLLNHFGDASSIFKAGSDHFANIPGIGPGLRKSIATFDKYPDIQKEISFLQKHRIRPLFFTDPEYPQRLLPIKNAPTLLFYRGNADLNTSKIVSIVGTRTPTEYGRQTTATLIQDLRDSNILILSGLAYGIDTLAHTNAFQTGLPTVGILGHGLDRIYPTENTALARKMVTHGGLLTQFGAGIDADECNFPVRNRVVAGMCDAVIVVETGVHGGSLLTVSNAVDYGKKIFAVPGRLTDPLSKGCNKLIAEGTATPFIDGSQFLKEMQWDRSSQIARPTQPELFKTPAPQPPAAPTNISPEADRILDLLHRHGELSFDKLTTLTSLPANALSMSLFQLELRGIIQTLPGKRFRINKLQ